MTETADIVVVGGGCIGAAITLHLAEKKAGKVILLEQKELANGASGKGIGIIRTHYTHPVLAKLAYESLQLFHHFPERFGGYDAGFNPCGYFVLVGESDVETLHKIVSMHQQMNINVSLVEPQQLQAAFGIPLDLSDVAAIAYEPDSGYGSPPKTTVALARRAAELGADIRTHTPVQEIQRDAQGRIQGVKTFNSEIGTRIVVDCVGAWAKKFAQHLGLEFPVTPVVEHITVVDRSVEFSVPHPVLSDLINLCYLRSDPDQPYTRIGNSDPKYHSQFALKEADDFKGQLFPNICEELNQKLIHRCPGLKKAPLETYSGMWAVTPDYQPIIDHLDYVPGLFCAVGFSGHGYKLSPIVGDIVSRFVLGQMDEQVELLNLFRLSRFCENALIKAPLSYTQARGLR